MENNWNIFLNKTNKTYPEEMLCQAILMFARDEESIYQKILKRVEFIKKMKKNNFDSLTNNDHENYIAARKIIRWLLSLPIRSEGETWNKIKEELHKVANGELQAALALGDLMNRFPNLFSLTN